MISGFGVWRNGGPETPWRSTKEKTMDPYLMEWGPAHLRDEPAPELEYDDRPDDN